MYSMVERLRQMALFRKADEYFLRQVADELERLQQADQKLKWCAKDLDECTVTLAFDTEDEVREFCAGHESRRRVLSYLDD